MKTSIYLTIISVFVILSCSDGYQSKSNIEKPVLIENITINDLSFLFENINNQEVITKKLDSLNFRKKLNGIYRSLQLIEVDEPKHWIHIYNLGELSSVSFSTVDRGCWKKLQKELLNFGNQEPFEDGTTDKANRYIGNKFTFETYEPKGGVNLSLNNLYQVIILNTK